MSGAAASPLRDARGHIVTGANSAALDHLERATWRLVSFYGNPFDELGAAAAESPGCVMAHVALANLCLTTSERQFVAQAQSALGAAREHLGAATARERMHVEASTLAAQGRWDDAGAAWDRLLREYPLDLFALQAAHLFDFYRGDAAQLRARVARVLPQWSEQVPLYSYVLGMYAFGAEECNRYAQAEEAGRRALDIDARDPWAVHAVAHVMEMNGRVEDGIEWLRARSEVWSPDNGFAFHNWWHLALFHLERGEVDAVLMLYDERIGSGELVLQWLDATSLLWRLRLLGHDVGARWQPLAQRWREALEREAGHYAFNDWHAALALHAVGDRDGLAVLRAAMQRTAEAGAATLRMMADEVGLPLLAALDDFESGRYRKAAEAFTGLRRVAMRCGGSHAQRDLIDQTALVAALRAGDAALARVLANERTLAKPHSSLARRYAEQARSLLPPAVH